MSGREAVRSFREGGSFASKPPPPQWLKSAAFGLVLALAGLGAFVAVVYLVPLLPFRAIGPMSRTVDASFSDIPNRIGAPPRAPASTPAAHAAATSKSPAFSHAEQQRCDTMGQTAYDAYASGRGHTDDVHNFETAAGVTVMSSNVVACMAATRPSHLCDPGDAYTFAEYERIFARAGFSRSEFHPLPPTAQQAVVSYKD
jgi:hypothetical protein